MGGWAVAQSAIPGITITVERLARRGYQFLLSYCVNCLNEWKFSSDSCGIDFTLRFTAIQIDLIQFFGNIPDDGIDSLGFMLHFFKEPWIV